MKYELIEHDGRLAPKHLKQIRALRDIPEIGVKKGDLGGFIESEKNLSQEGSCWVSGSARVYDSAWVCDSALVYDSALVSGSAWVSMGHVTKTSQIKSATVDKYVVTVSPWWVRIGCVCLTRDEWDKQVPELAKEHCESEDDIWKWLTVADALLLCVEE